jgi:hypothetical protein
MDFHPSFPVAACVNTETGEILKRRLSHPPEANEFYCSLADQPIRFGIEYPLAKFRDHDVLAVLNGGPGSIQNSRSRGVLIRRGMGSCCR